jgi:hypothetical protein
VALLVTTPEDRCVVPGWQYCWNPWFRERHVYSVPLSVPDCLDRLKAGTRFRLHGPVARLWFTRGAWLHHRTFFTHNSFKPCAHVRFRRTREATEVKVTIELRPIIQGAVTVWLGFAVLWTLEALIHIPSFGSWRDVVFPLSGIAFIGMFLLIFAFSRLLARKDREILLAYIEGRLLP